MNIEVYKLEVERDKRIGYAEYGKYISWSKSKIGTLTMSSIPPKGSIIVIDTAKYVVTEIIIEQYVNSSECYCTLQVEDYTMMRVYEQGSNSWEEKRPLVTDFDSDVFFDGR